MLDNTYADGIPPEGRRVTHRMVTGRPGGGVTAGPDPAVAGAPHAGLKEGAK